MFSYNEAAHFINAQQVDSAVLMQNGRHNDPIASSWECLTLSTGSQGHNLITEVGSSETTREDISLIQPHQDNNGIEPSEHRFKHRYPSNNEEWGFYLAGLIDADGSFTNVSKTQPKLTIAFHMNDISLAYKIRQFLRFGTIAKIKNKKAYTYVLTNRFGFLRLLPLLYGKLQHTLKKERYALLCSYYGIVPDKQGTENSSLRLVNNY